MVALGHRAFRLSNQALNITQVEAVVLLPTANHGHLPLAFNRYAQQAVVQLLKIDNPDVGADIIKGRLTGGFFTVAQQHNDKATIFSHAAGQHIDVTRLKELERDTPSGQHNGIQREQGNIHNCVIH